MFKRKTNKKIIQNFFCNVTFLFALTLLTAYSSNHAYASTTSESKNAPLRLGFAFSSTSLDPHFRNIQPNNSLISHTHESLFLSEIGKELKPILAKSWKLIDKHTWQIKLKENVLFHDNSPFTATDVIYSFERIAQSGEESDYREYLNSIDKIEAIDDYTLKITTLYPHPYLLHSLSYIYIIKADPDVKPDQNTISQKLKNKNILIGTGNYQHENIDQIPDDLNHIKLITFKNYHAKHQDISQVDIITYENREARLQALIDGKLDVIEKLLPSELPLIRAQKNFEILESTSLRLMQLQMDQHRDQTPYAMSMDGKPLKQNPFKDYRVRAAIAHAIDKKRIINEVLDGAGETTTQLVPKQSFSSSPNLRDTEYNPSRSRTLLKQAGFPDGFKLILHATNDRYIRDTQVAKIIAQMLSDVGIMTTVVDLPKSDFFPMAFSHNFSFMLFGWSSDDGRVSNVLEPLLMTKNLDKGEGIYNMGRYSNSQLDKIIISARAEFNPSKKLNLLRYATEIAVNDYALIPLYFQPAIYAYHNSLAFKNPNQTIASYNAAKFVRINNEIE